MKLWIFRLSLVANVLLCFALVYLWPQGGEGLQHWVEQHHQRRVSTFESYPVNAGQVVFLGDSITEAGEWSEMFPAFAVVNRGIGGDTTTGVLARLDQVTSGKPRAVFLKIGTNDVNLVPQRDTSYRQYKEIVERIQEESPATHIFLQSLLPRSVGYRGDIEAWNEYIEALAADTGTTYIDLYSRFLDDDGSIRNAYSNDELHLTGAGYQLWQSIIAPHIEALATDSGG